MDVDLIIGIDPGIYGGLAYAIRDSPVDGLPLPTIPRKGKTRGHAQELDLIKVHRLIAERMDWSYERLGSARLWVVVEKVWSFPGQGVASTFLFGKTYGALLGIISSLPELERIIEPTPAQWKKHILGKRDADKQDALDYVAGKYPHIWLNYPGPNGVPKPHDGLAEAVCLVDYGLMQYLDL